MIRTIGAVVERGLERESTAEVSLQLVWVALVGKIGSAGHV
jgi:hypothetical protein